MKFRLLLALVGVVAALIGHDADTPAVLVFGLAACVPLAVKVLAVPAHRQAAFALTAGVAGLALAGFAAGHHSPVDQRPVPAACVVTR